MLKPDELAQGYETVATRELEPMVHEAAQAIDADNAAVEHLRICLTRAWIAGASAASRDEEVAEAARLAQSVKRAVLRGIVGEDAPE